MEVTVISDSIQEFNGKRFYRCDKYFQHKGLRLHRAVWIYHNGEVPYKHHVHHIDESRDNNGILNLMVKHGSDHLSLHSKKANHDKAIKAAQDASKEWHASEEGRAWHREHFEKVKDKMFVMVSKTCEHCGIEFTGLDRTKFCSNNCKSANRRKSGIDNVEAICPKCGSIFQTSKYVPRKYCSSCFSRKST